MSTVTNYRLQMPTYCYDQFNTEEANMSILVRSMSMFTYALPCHHELNGMLREAIVSGRTKVALIRPARVCPTRLESSSVANAKSCRMD